MDKIYEKCEKCQHNRNDCHDSWCEINRYGDFVTGGCVHYKEPRNLKAFELRKKVDFLIEYLQGLSMEFLPETKEEILEAKKEIKKLFEELEDSN